MSDADKKTFLSKSILKKTASLMLNKWKIFTRMCVMTWTAVLKNQIQTLWLKFWKTKEKKWNKLSEVLLWIMVKDLKFHSYIVPSKLISRYMKSTSSRKAENGTGNRIPEKKQQLNFFEFDGSAKNHAIMLSFSNSWVCSKTLN